MAHSNRVFKESNKWVFLQKVTLGGEVLRETSEGKRGLDNKRGRLWGMDPIIGQMHIDPNITPVQLLAEPRNQRAREPQ